MSGSAAHVTPEAIQQVARALVRYGEAETAVVHTADAGVQQVADEVADEVKARQLKVRHADEALQACRREEDRDCSGLVQDLNKAEQALDQARQASTIVARAAAAFQMKRSKHMMTVQGLVDGGRARLRMNATDLAAYLGASSAGGVDFGTAGMGASPASAASGLAVPPGVPDGFALVPLSAIDPGDNPVTGPADFGKGYTAEDLAWGIEALHSVVLPALAIGKGADYFADRDAREGRFGTRSYSDTHSGFFNHDAVRLESSGDGRFTVGNGRHRIWVAQQRGDSVIIAKVS